MACAKTAASFLMLPPASGAAALMSLWEMRRGLAGAGVRCQAKTARRGSVQGVVLAGLWRACLGDEATSRIPPSDAPLFVQILTHVIPIPGSNFRLKLTDLSCSSLECRKTLGHWGPRLGMGGREMLWKRALVGEGGINTAVFKTSRRRAKYSVGGDASVKDIARECHISD